MSRTPQAQLDMEPAPGRALLGTLLGGKYTMLRVLGEGGVGVVYEAENSWTGRRVALKVLRPEFAVRREVVRRFKREAQAATRIDHPNIVDVLDMGEDRAHGTLYIVQELLTGTDLRCWLDHRGVLAASEALEILTPIMGALVAAHRRGIIHRDIKPENIFLVRGPGGRVIPKLIDFGISKILDANSPGPKTTVTGTAVGTPNYMSPEQARGDVVLDGRSDVWSLGAVMYEMLCGRPPFEAATHTLLLVRIVTERPARVDDVNPGVSSTLAAIVHRALEPNPAERYPSMRAMLADLVETPGFGDDSDARGLPAEQWDELQIAPIARDAARAETLPMGMATNSTVGRLPLYAATAAALAMIAAAFVIPVPRGDLPHAAIHAGMPRSDAPDAPAPVRTFVKHETPPAIASPTVTQPLADPVVADAIASVESLSAAPAMHHASVHHVHLPTAMRTAATPGLSHPRPVASPASASAVRASPGLRPLSAYPDE